MNHFNKDAQCRNCCHKEYCYANTGWDERAQTCMVYNIKEKRWVVDRLAVKERMRIKGKLV